MRRRAPPQRRHAGRGGAGPLLAPAVPDPTHVGTPMTTRLLPVLWALLLLLPARRAAADAGAELTGLSYHEIADRADALVPLYAVTPTNFVRQMDWLRNHGYHFVAVADVLAAREGRRPLPP